MFTAVPQVFLLDPTVQAAREKVVDDTTLRETLRAGVLPTTKLVPESGGALAPMSASKSEELSSGEVTGMCRNDVEKARLSFCITESLQGFDVRRFDVHAELI